MVLNGEDGIIKKVEEESSNSVFLIRSDNYIRNWQNPEKLRKIVKDTGAKSTDLESLEDVEHLCSKCDKYAACWAKEADKIWNSKKHNNKGKYQNYAPHRRDNL